MSGPQARSPDDPEKLLWMLWRAAQFHILSEQRILSKSFPQCLKKEREALAPGSGVLSLKEDQRWCPQKGGV